MTWFERLTGCQESSPDGVRGCLTLRGNQLISSANGRALGCGQLHVQSLEQLRVQVASSREPAGSLSVRECVADVSTLHADSSNAGAMFQVASQFNLLEMVSPDVTPEEGVGRYESDLTQGPACAIAAGGGTIFRNYFVEVDGVAGQTRDRQIDCLAPMGIALGNAGNRLWKMQNGYVQATQSGLEEIGSRLASSTEFERDDLRSHLQIGVQQDVDVTIDSCEHQVSQAFCSALPVRYSEHAPALWEPFARLILEAAYDATLCAARVNAARTGSRRVFLTLLGGDAFGNDLSWILDGLRFAMRRHANAPLDVEIVSFGQSNPAVTRWLALP